VRNSAQNWQRQRAMVWMVRGVGATSDDDRLRLSCSVMRPS